MSFKDDARLDTSQVARGGRSSGRSAGSAGRIGSSGGAGGGLGGGTLAAGGGLGGLLLIVLVVLLGGGLGTGPDGDGTQPGGPAGWDYSTARVSTSNSASGGSDFTHCRTGADANEHLDCRMIGAVNSVQAFWGDTLTGYQPTTTVLFEGAVSTGCGQATSAVGPFYCPLDQQIYIDISFFRQLERMGSDGGALSQMYVVAHEYAHHIQHLTGVLSRADRQDTGPTSDAVRIELQADCYAGAWVAHADGTRTGNSDAMLEPVTQDQIDSALSAAAAVGDDRIQETTAGRVTPESWTHGSSQQRQHWFMVGYRSGDPNHCDTFAVSSLDP